MFLILRHQLKMLNRKLYCQLMHRSNILTSLISNNGLGVFKVIGFNLLPKPAHKIKAVFILTTLPYKFWKIIF